MKIIFLNLWNAKLADELREYLITQAPTTDVFCFQEIHDTAHALCREVLEGYQEIRAGKRTGHPHRNGFTQAIYSKTEILDAHTIFPTGFDIEIALCAEISWNGTSVHIANLHGITYKDIDTKLDTPIRLKQSQGIINYLATKNGIRVIGGDYNILPNTESIEMHEKHGYRDLIKDYHIETTRNEHSWKNWPRKLLYSDYVFTSKEISIKNFTVPNDIVSDHLPLVLELTL